MFLVSYFSVHSQAHQAHDQIFAQTALGIMPASEIRCARPLAPAVRSWGGQSERRWQDHAFAWPPPHIRPSLACPVSLSWRITAMSPPASQRLKTHGDSLPCPSLTSALALGMQPHGLVSQSPAHLPGCYKPSRPGIRWVVAWT